MSVTAESRAAFVVEPDAKLRITGTYLTDNGCRCTVEIRRGVGESLTVTIEARELLRIVAAACALS